MKLAAEVGGRAATFLLLLLAARHLSTVDFGRYNYALAFGFVLVPLADFGLQLLLTREVARLGMAAKIRVQEAFHLKLWLALPTMLLLWLFSAGQPPGNRLILLLLGLTLLLQTFVEFVGYVFRGQQQLGIEVRLLIWVRLGTAVWGAIVLWLSSQLVWLALASLMVMVSAVVLALRMLKQAGWISHYRQLWPTAWPGGTLSRALLRQAWPLGLSIFLSIAYTRLAILMLGALRDAEAVAHYSAAWRLVEPTQILPASLLAAVFPAFSLALGQNRSQAGRLGRQTSLFLALAGTVLALVFWFAAPGLVPWLYGAEFASSVPILQLLGLTILPVYINYSLTHYLVARGQQHLLTGLTALTLLLHAGLCWLLIPQLGLLGPPLSVLIVESVLLLGCFWALRQPALLESVV